MASVDVVGVSKHAEVDRLPQVGDALTDDGTTVEVYSRAQLPTEHGTFEIFVFKNNRDDKEHVALVRGQVRGAERVAMRVHSECLTGDVLASLKCDCRSQLLASMAELGRRERGLLVYMRQEGRGIGLGNKIRAYSLQQRGMDTVEANLHLGFDDDHRDYAVAALITRLFAPESVELLTNNPRKVFGLKQLGVEVLARLPLVCAANPHNASYLETKRRRSGHLLP